MALARKSEGFMVTAPTGERRQVDISAETASRVVSDLLDDEALALSEAKRIIGRAQAAGRLALSQAVEVAPTSDQVFLNLQHAITAARSGDATALSVVRENVRTDLIERTIKSGFIIESVLSSNEQGNLIQHGQTLEDIQVNALRYASDMPQMRARTEAEARNHARLQHQFKQGKLDDNYFVVVSRCADDMTDQQAREAGFFVDEASCAIQVTTVRNGQVVLESAFVAGRQSSDQPRFDKPALDEVLIDLGLDSTDLSATELLDKPLLIPKDQLPNGVASIVERYDDALGGTFFGQKKPRQDYVQFKQACQQRESNYVHDADRVVKMILDSSVPLNKPVDAIRLLDKLSHEVVFERALLDTAIDSRVFGSAGARHIDEARFYASMGQQAEYQRAYAMAKITAVSSSCPSGLGYGPGQIGSQLGGDSLESSDQEESGSKKVVTCPFCRSRVSIDPCARRITCSDCYASVVDGKVKSTGNGGRRAQRARQKAKEAAAKDKQVKLRHKQDAKTKSDQVEAKSAKQPINLPGAL